MNIFLILAYLFFCGSLIGWVIELLYRRFLSKANPERKWINPGFCIGPYIPLYGFGLCIFYLFACFEKHILIENPFWRKGLLIILTTLSITLVEYIAGLICLKVFKVRLWDYSETKFNIQGLICPFFTLIWGVMSAIYLLFIHSYILDSLVWLSHNLTFTFVIGFFYGVFTVDVVYSSHLIAKIKAYAQENEIVVKWEMLKADIRNKAEKLGEKTPFLFPMKFYRLIIKRRKEDKKISDFEKENKNEKIIGN